MPNPEHSPEMGFEAVKMQIKSALENLQFTKTEETLKAINEVVQSIIPKPSPSEAVLLIGYKDEMLKELKEKKYGPKAKVKPAEKKQVSRASARANATHLEKTLPPRDAE